MDDQPQQMRWRFSICNLGLDSIDEPEHFETLTAAEQRAIRYTSDKPLAVFDDEVGWIVSLVYSGAIYRRLNDPELAMLDKLAKWNAMGKGARL